MIPFFVIAAALLPYKFVSPELYIPILPEKNVIPSYNWTYLTTQLHSYHLMVDTTMEELTSRKAARHAKDCCLTHASNPRHVRNTLKTGYNMTEIQSDPAYTYLHNSTFWINEYLHMGHVHYIIVLMQVMQLAKIDRVVMQRAICFSTLCWGMNTMESWYKGFFAAVFEASGRPLIPLYVRWDAKDKYVRPMYFSVNSSDNYVDLKFITNEEEKKPILLQHITCFEELYSHDNLRLGAVPAVSSKAIHRFKSIAYKMVNSTPPLTTYFSPPTNSTPYTNLFGYRGSKLTRSMDNVEEFITLLRSRFPAPLYRINPLNPSDPPLGYKAQIQAVAEAHVVIANHGAFEMNMIYMRNSSLLLEIFGDYSVAEMHTFHRTATMFGVFYGRHHARGLHDHDQKNYSMTAQEMGDVMALVANYFELKPFLHNQLNA